MKSFTTFAAIAALAATPLAAAQSTICDYTELAQAFPDTELDQCQSESGFDLFSSTAPTPTTLAKFCESDTCVSLWKAAVALNIPECSINGVDLVGEILEPIETACKRNVNVRRLDGDMTKTTTVPSTTTPSSTTVKTPSTASATPSTTAKTPSTASTTPSATTAAKTPSATSASTTPSTTAKTPSTTPSATAKTPSTTSSAAKTPSTTPSATAKTPTATSSASTLKMAVGTVVVAAAVVMF